ncbi:hypothetical protein ALC53_12666, partial [Atta colombica]
DRAHKRSKSSAKALSVSQENTAFHSAANDCANNRYGKSDLTPFTVHVQDSSNVTEAFYKVVIKRSRFQRTASVANSLVENAALANYDLIVYIPTKFFRDVFLYFDLHAVSPFVPKVETYFSFLLQNRTQKHICLKYTKIYTVVCILGKYFI